MAMQLTPGGRIFFGLLGGLLIWGGLQTAWWGWLMTVPPGIGIVAAALLPHEKFEQLVAETKYLVDTFRPAVQFVFVMVVGLPGLFLGGVQVIDGLHSYVGLTTRTATVIVVLVAIWALPLTVWTQPTKRE